MGIYKDNNIIGLATPIDAELIADSTNPVQNSTLVRELAKRVSLSGDTINGSLDMGSNPISLNGANLTADGTTVKFAGNEIDTVPELSYDDFTLSSPAYGGARVLRCGKLRIFETSSYIGSTSTTTTLGKVLDMDKPSANASAAYGVVCSSSDYGRWGRLVVTTGGYVYMYTTQSNVDYVGQVMWFVD